MTSTDPISVQDHNAIIMEAEAATITGDPYAYPKLVRYIKNGNMIQLFIENGHGFYQVPNNRIIIIADYKTTYYQISNVITHIVSNIKLKSNEKTHKITIKFDNGASLTKFIKIE